MTVQAQAADVPKASGLSRRDLLGTVAILLVGAVFIVLGSFGTEPGDQSAFTDQSAGTLLALPSQATLYAVGLISFFIAGGN